MFLTLSKIILRETANKLIFVIFVRTWCFKLQKKMFCLQLIALRKKLCTDSEQIIKIKIKKKWIKWKILIWVWRKSNKFIS